MESLGIISSKFTQRVNLTPWYNVCEQLSTNNMILFLPLFPVPCGIFKDEQRLFILLANKMKYLSSLFTIFPPPPFSKPSFEDLRQEQDRSWLVCCAQKLKGARKKENHSQTSGVLENVFFFRKIYSKPHLSSMYKINYFLKYSRPSNSLLEIYL